MRTPRRVIGLVLSVLVAGTSFSTAHAGDAKAEVKKPGAVYAQLSSKSTQRPTSTAPTIVNLESNDGMAGMQVDAAKPSDMVVKTPGVYFVIAAAQVAKTTGTNPEYLDMWFRKNGKDIDNTNTRQALTIPTATFVLVSQGLVELKANDVINIAISASSADKGVGLVATTPKGEPTIPSIIVSMFKVN